MDAVLLGCSMAHAEGGSVPEQVALSLPYPVVSMLDLHCQL